MCPCDLHVWRSVRGVRLPESMSVLSVVGRLWVINLWIAVCVCVMCAVCAADRILIAALWIA